MKEIENIHSDLVIAKNFVYEANGLTCKNLTKEGESKEYGAATFELNEKSIKFRVGKITPTKIGQFVTLWKRMNGGEIQPHDVTDPIDFFVISVRDGDQFGQFIFSKAILFEKGILAKDGKGGKLAIRIYPPWDKPLNRQAKRSQEWQLPYFFEIPQNNKIDLIKMQTLFN